MDHVEKFLSQTAFKNSTHPPKMKFLLCGRVLTMFFWTFSLRTHYLQWKDWLQFLPIYKRLNFTNLAFFTHIFDSFVLGIYFWSIQTVTKLLRSKRQTLENLMIGPGTSKIFKSFVKVVDLKSCFSMISTWLKNAT